MICKQRTSPVWKVDSTEFANMVATSTTFSEVLKKLGMNSKGGNSKTLKIRLIHDGIDFSHISQGMGHNKGKHQIRKSAPLETLLIAGSKYSRTCLKRRLITDGILPSKCAICGMQPEWNGKILVLILDHINGISDDNRIENLRLVCPNCNSQLGTHCGKNNKRVIPTKENGYLCPVCGEKKSKSSKYCRDCRTAHDKRLFREKNFDADMLELKKLLSITRGNITNVGKHLNISGTAVKKRCKKLGINPSEFRPNDRPRCVCGTILRGSGTECMACYRKKHGYVDRPSKEELIQALTNTKTNEVALKFKVSRQVVLRWCRAYEIPTTNKRIAEYIKNLSGSEQVRKGE